MVKRFLSVILCVAMLFCAAMLPSIAQAMEHVHSGNLLKIMTENVDGIDFCGKFHCDSCGEDYYAPVTYKDLGMPVINLEGSKEGMSKENEIPMTLTYSSENVNFTSVANIKWQGGTSTGFEKKNYTVKLFKEDGSKNKVKIVDSWGKQSKYCLKANWVDASHARNIVSARIYNEIVHSRMLDDELEALPNGGAIDGFPVALYENGQFYGLYTLNIPKDNWAWGMNDENKMQALLFAGTWSDAVRLNAPIADVNNPEASGFEIEYCSTEDNPEVGCAWVSESFNTFINFLTSTTNKTQFRNNAQNYFSVERAIDVLIYTCYIHGDDNMAKNIVWATYDGTKWIPCMYDMDATWGLFWDGTMNISPKGAYMGGGNLMFSRLLDFYPDEIMARYKELRGDILSRKTIEYYFRGFFDSVTNVVKMAEKEKWSPIPSFDKNTYNSIYSFATERLSDYDNHYGVTVKENTRWGGKVSFNTDDGCKFYVYPYEDYSVQPNRAVSAYPVNSEGTVSRTDNEVNFLIVPPEGMLIEDVKVAQNEGYSDFLTPDKTGKENVYRISNITSYIDVEVTLKENPVGYSVNFDCGGNADILVYPGSDYTKVPEKTLSALSVDSDTGIPTRSGDGQVNFKIVPHTGYKIVSVEASARNYKNLKTPDDTGEENTYRFTKVSGDFTVTVTLEKKLTLKGDVNLDGKVTAADAVVMKKCIVGKTQLTDSIISNGDINGDGKINASDMTLLKKIIVGKLSSV